MSVRRLQNGDQVTVTSPELQNIPNADNAMPNFLGVKFHDGLGLCCGDSKFPCAYVITPTALTAVTAITFKDKTGTNKTVTFTSVSTPKAIRIAIANALYADGIDPYYQGDLYKGIHTADGVVTLVSTVEIVSLTVDGTAVAATKKCNTNAECTYRISFDFSTDPGKVGQASAGGTQIGTTSGWAAGNASSVRTAVNTALGTAGFTLNAVTKVTNNVADGRYDVTFTVVSTTPLYYQGVELYGTCSQAFVV